MLLIEAAELDSRSIYFTNMEDTVIPQRGFIHLLIGGARSGKSTRAEILARQEQSPTTLYVATCATTVPLDDQMHERVQNHRAQRPAEWTTVENRFDLDVLFCENAGSVVIVDCLTLWISWWVGEGLDEAHIFELLAKALDAAHAYGIRLYLVSNELGMGLVPLGEDNRAFRDLCGRANQVAAGIADVVEFMVAGLPLGLKGTNRSLSL